MKECLVVVHRSRIDLYNADRVHNNRRKCTFFFLLNLIIKYITLIQSREPEVHLLPLKDDWKLWTLYNDGLTIEVTLCFRQGSAAIETQRGWGQKEKHNGHYSYGTMFLSIKWEKFNSVAFLATKHLYCFMVTVGHSQIKNSAFPHVCV